MATTVDFSAASPYALTARIDGTGGASILRGTVLAACVNGPLKALLTKTVDWTVFNLNGAACAQVHVRELINRSSGIGANPETVEFFWEADGFKADATAAGVQQLEIRCQHSSRA
jgi:hypothetical protein